MTPGPAPRWVGVPVRLVLLLPVLLAGLVLPAAPAAPSAAAAVGSPSSVAVAASPLDEVRWLCHPELRRDPCRVRQTTTVQEADGSSVVVEPATRRVRGVDCFFVYPTVSNQPQPNALPVRAPEVRAIARLQAARFSTVCDVWAPVYRQRTLPALAAEDLFTPEQKTGFFAVAYADVLAAWRAYLAEAGPRRGFVLLGHSQGSRILRKLVREEVDPVPSLRRRLVSAVLPGADVLVAQGRDRGGDFAAVPACRRPGQVGCVAAWSAYDEGPPPDSRFGRAPAEPDGTGLPSGDGLEVLCTDPAALARRDAVVRPVLRTEPFPGVIGLLLVQFLGGPPPVAPTPYVVPPDRYRVGCAERDGADVLEVVGVDGARDLTPAPDATWGLHLGDLNLVLDEAVAMVRLQARAWAAGR